LVTDVYKTLLYSSESIACTTLQISEPCVKVYVHSTQRFFQKHCTKNARFTA